MKRFFVWLNAFHIFLAFSLPAVLLFPFYLLFIYTPVLRRKGIHFLHRLWTYIFFVLAMIPVKVICHPKISKDDTYVFCCNHFSYLDIPILGFTRSPFIFVGKSSLARVPIFGFVFRKTNITVDRSNAKSRYESLTRSKQAVDQRISPIIFAEGGIRTTNPPRMASFKDGAFKIAIEKQIPLVPVVIPYNWIFLPDGFKFDVHRMKLAVEYLEPIQTTGLTLKDIDKLKEEVYQILQEKLDRYNDRIFNANEYA